MIPMMYVCMYGWMDGWMYRCMYVCITDQNVRKIGTTKHILLKSINDSNDVCMYV